MKISLLIFNFWVAIAQAWNARLNPECILFFTGGSNFFSTNIYHEFTDVITSKSIDVYNIPFNMKITQSNIDALMTQYDNIHALGHSSGCTTLLNQCNLDGLKHVFLIDPVNTDLFGKKHKYKVSQYTSISFIHAMKSYKTTFEPFGLPFIPAFKLNYDNLYIDKLTDKDQSTHPIFYELNIDNYGHSDILNTHISNFMHATRISVGHHDRSSKVKLQLLQYIAEYIEKTISSPTCYQQT